MTLNEKERDAPASFRSWAGRRSIGGIRVASGLWLLWLIALLAVAVGSLVPQVAPPAGLHADKIVHLVAYALLAALPGFLVRRVPLAILVCMGLALMGGGLELAQSHVPGRVTSGADIVMNLIGVAIGWTIGWRVRNLTPKLKGV